MSNTKINMKVATWNINRGEDENFEAIKEGIGQMGADIVFLTEVTENNPSACEEKNVALCLAEELDYHAETGISLRQEDSGVTWDLGNAVLVRNDIEVLEHEVVFLSTRESYMEMKKRFDRGEEVVLPLYEPRIALILKLRKDGQEFTVVGVHLGYSPWFKDDSEVRREQVKVLSEKISGIEGPVIVAGDMNMVPESDELSKFLADTRMRNAEGANQINEPTWKRQITGVGAIGPERSAAAISAEGSDKAKIDYILASGGIELKGVEMLDVGGSDHKPLVAELEIL